ncbi:MAG: CotH kinase family protein [Bacteroidaceae bacterium]|nr:CotH kinase family protein [Bacteroidaceae bacterium]
MRKVWFVFGVLIVTLVLGGCKDENDELAIIEPREISTGLKNFRFLAKNNPEVLISDIECTIIGDSIIECLIPYIVENKILIPSFEVSEGKITINDNDVVSDETKIDCAKPLIIRLEGEEKTFFFILRVKSFTGLPVVYIDTENAVDITSKDDYVNGFIRIVEDIETRASGDIFESAIKIKGRGNSTWGMPKKPYKIKFDEKTSLFEEPADKEWVLLANYTDKTSLRNEIAFEMGRISNLDYTCRTHYVEVILNGIYNGTYQLGEQLKIAKHRVNVGDDGYLLEIDARVTAEDVAFKVAHISQPVNIKEPDMEMESEAYNYVVQYLQKADSALFSENFMDATNGYARYLDVESFVEWYLINEIAKNNDACFFTSCYMNLVRDGKLKMGPLWDFDIAFGNVNYNGCEKPEGFWIKPVAWYARLFQDPNFVQKVKERFAYFYNKRKDIYTKINTNAEYLRYSIIENNNKWKTLYVYTWPNNTIWGSYENEVQSVKIWLEKRFQWLNEQFAAM